MNTDKPLFLDERLEEQERAGSGNVLARWLKKWFPGFAYHAPPRGRPSIEAQLRQRVQFSPEQWSTLGPLPDVVGILEIVRRELDLPNAHFIPDDPLVLIFGSAYDFEGFYALWELEEKYEVKYQEEELESIRKAEWTLGQFVKDFLERAKDAGKERGGKRKKRERKTGHD